MHEKLMTRKYQVPLANCCYSVTYGCLCHTKTINNSQATMIYKHIFSLLLFLLNSTDSFVASSSFFLSHLALYIFVAHIYQKFSSFDYFHQHEHRKILQTKQKKLDFEKHYK